MTVGVEAFILKPYSYSGAKVGGSKIERDVDGLRRRRDLCLEPRLMEKVSGGGGRGGEDKEEVKYEPQSFLFLIGTLLLSKDEDCRSATEALEATTSAEEEEADGDDVDDFSFFIFVDVKPCISNPKEEGDGLLSVPEGCCVPLGIRLILIFRTI